MDGQVQNLQVKSCGAKQQFIIAPSVFDSPASQHRFDALPVASPEDLRATKRILYVLSEQVRKCDTEKFVAQHVGCGHRSFWHWINESRSVDKLRLPRGDNIDKVRKLFGNSGQIGIEDHQNIACGSIETGPDISRFGYAWSAFQADIPVRIERLHSQYFFGSPIGRLIITENNFCLTPQLRNALRSIFDISFFIFTRNDH